MRVENCSHCSIFLSYISRVRRIKDRVHVLKGIGGLIDGTIRTFPIEFGAGHRQVSQYENTLPGSHGLGGSLGPGSTTNQVNGVIGNGVREGEDVEAAP